MINNQSTFLINLYNALIISIFFFINIIKLEKKRKKENFSVGNNFIENFERSEDINST